MGLLDWLRIGSQILDEAGRGQMDNAIEEARRRGDYDRVRHLQQARTDIAETERLNERYFEALDRAIDRDDYDDN